MPLRFRYYHMKSRSLYATRAGAQKYPFLAIREQGASEHIMIEHGTLSNLNDI